MLGRAQRSGAPLLRHIWATESHQQQCMSSLCSGHVNRSCTHWKCLTPRLRFCLSAGKTKSCTLHKVINGFSFGGNLGEWTIVHRNFPTVLDTSYQPQCRWIPCTHVDLAYSITMESRHEGLAVQETASLNDTKWILWGSVQRTVKIPWFSQLFCVAQEGNKKAARWCRAGPVPPLANLGRHHSSHSLGNQVDWNALLELVQRVHVVVELVSEQSLVAEPLEMLVRSPAKCLFELPHPPHPSLHSLIRRFRSAPPSASLPKGVGNCSSD